MHLKLVHVILSQMSDWQDQIDWPAKLKVKPMIHFENEEKRVRMTTNVISTQNIPCNVTATEMITPRVPDPLKSAKNESSEITVNRL